MQCAWASPVAQMVKSLPAMQETHPGSIPGSGRSPGEANVYSLQYSCLENSTDRGSSKLEPKGLQRVAHD